MKIEGNKWNNSEGNTERKRQPTKLCITSLV